MVTPTAITPEDLFPLIGTAVAPQIVDVSLDEDFQEDPFLIPGAFRHPHIARQALADRIDGPAVIVCQKGRKLSQGIAAWLRTEGIDARYLVGGNHGWRVRCPGFRIAVGALPEAIDGATLWVAPETADAATLSAAWALRRFVDPAARLLFVRGEEIPGVAERLGATPLPPANDLVGRLNLDHPVLARLTGVGTAQAQPDDGLTIVLSGLARLHPEPLARLDAALPIFDALWSELRHREENAR